MFRLLRKRKTNEPEKPKIDKMSKSKKILDNRIVAERRNYVREYLQKRLAERIMDVEIIWTPDYESVKIIDETKHLLAKINWKTGEAKIDEFITPTFVARANTRLEYSCAIGERLHNNDKSQMGRVAAARSEVGGVMCTN